MNRRGFLRFLAATPLAAALAPSIPAIEIAPVALAAPVVAGAITSITITNCGSGYTSPPTFVMTA